MLGQMLKEHRNFAGESIAVVSGRAKKTKNWPERLGRSEAFLSNLETGQTTIQEDEHIEFIAKAYQIEPFLLSAYTQSEPVDHHVVFNLKKGFSIQPIGLPINGAIYKVAPFHLRSSEFTISHLQLKPGEKGPTHKHRGEEFQICFQGKMILVFPTLPEGSREAEVPRDHFIHFKPNLEHYGENRGKTDTVVLILRQHCLPSANGQTAATRKKKE